jgi:toxin ParE1/3/4
MSGYRLRERAEVDLADTWRYTARRWNVVQADKYYRQILERLNALAVEPQLGRPCDEVRAGYRRYNVGSHVIFYLRADDHVDVVRNLHARRDFARDLPKS